jgi:hypothetical protein
LQKVQYEDQRILRNIEGSDLTQLSPQDQELLRCTKYSHWRYEEEFRYFVSLDEAIKEGNLHFCPFGDTLKLVEVILGHQCEMSLDAVRTLTRGHYHHAVTTFKARLAFKSFDVVPDERTVP